MYKYKERVSILKKCGCLSEHFKIFIVAIFIAVISVIASFLNGHIKNVLTTKETSINSGLYDKVVIVIDAGHGGLDGGASSSDGTLEKELNLEIAQKLYSMFSLSNVSCVMTRSDDRMLYDETQTSRKKYYDLKNRVEFAKTFEEPIFVSIHQNKFPIKKYSGLQVYYSKNNPQSKVLADIIQDNTKNYFQTDNNRATKKANSAIFVLNNLDVPAVLVECGFLSNDNEAQLLKSDEYQKKIAFTIFVSVMQFLSNQNDI